MESHSAHGGFTLIELLIAILVLIVMMGLIIPAAGRFRDKTPRIKCVNHLRNIGLAFRIYATDNQGRLPMSEWTNSLNGGGPLGVFLPDPFFRALSNELATPKILECPADKTRAPAVNFSSLKQSNVSYFAGLPSIEGKPPSFLVGDRNLTTNGIRVKPGLIQVKPQTVVGWTSELHNRCGNVAMNDGSVQEFAGTQFSKAVRAAGLKTNWLAVP